MFAFKTMTAWLLWGIAAVCCLVVLSRIHKFWMLWQKANSGDSSLPLSRWIGMWLRNVDLEVVIEGRCAAREAGIDIPYNNLEALSLARGDVEKVVQALIEAKQNGISLSFRDAAAIDLAGRDVLEEVRSA